VSAKLRVKWASAEAAERAGESDGDLGLSRNVRDVAAVHSTLWPEDHNERGILNLGVLIGTIRPEPSKQIECKEVAE
jgi:hypothetical protein